ncbi:MAG: polysaccharide biosynthesis tyrosine autokinase [Desulfuromonadales bacterium]|nr:polysaccharide biosynthesis tyrosine autokinase [Desulfuromonadales bacterium]
MSHQIHLRDLLKIIRKNRFIILATIFVFISGALAINKMTTPQYEAKTKMVIERSEPSNLTDRSQNQYREPEFFETQYQILRSRAVARRVVDNLAEADANLLQELLAENNDPSLIGSVVTRLRAVINSGQPPSEPEANTAAEPTDPRDQLAGAISQRIKVRPVEGSRMVEISFLSTDPRFSSLVANSVVESYMAELNLMKAETTSSSLGWMNRKADAEAEKLKAAEKSLQDYMGENSVLTMENRIAIIPEKLSRISTELVTAQSRRKELETLNEKVSRVAVDPQQAESIAAILSDGALQSLRGQIVEAEKAVLELSGKYGSKHPAMQKAQADLDSLKRRKDQEIGRIARSIRNEYELALANERNLRAQMEEIKVEALQMNEKYMRYQTLQAEVDTNRKIFDALLTRMKEEGITSESQSVRMWVVEAAGIPRNPTLPNRRLNFNLGALLGLCGGLGLAFFREYLDNTIRNPDQAEVTFQTPVLGTISLSRRSRIEKIVLEEPLSALAEGYKSLRTTLLVGGSLPQKYLITSSIPGEGKTVTSVNLALAFAQAGLRVVLIDADLRKPRIHDIFRLRNSNGLSQLLKAPHSAQALVDALQPGPLENLRVLTAGPIPPNPSELLMSALMEQLLGRVAGTCDILICDSPPILAVEDSRILGRHFNGTLVVARAHQTDYEIAGRALKLLLRAKAPVLGFVVNGLDQRKSEYYYHSQYYTTYREEPLKLDG